MTEDNIDTKIEPLKYYHFTNDLIFSEIMNRNPKIVRSIIETILQKQIPKIRLINVENVLNHRKNRKEIRLDVYVQDEEGTNYIIEMQKTNRNIVKRMRYYQSVLDSEMIKAGIDYRNIPEIYIIFICTFDLFDTGNAKYMISSHIENHKEIEYNEGAYKIVINVSGDSDSLSSRESNLYDFIATGNTHDEPFLCEIKEKVDKINEEEEWRSELMTLEERFEDERYVARMEGIEIGEINGKRVGREEGRIEGKKEGREEGRIEGKKEGRIEGKREGIEIGEIKGEEKGKNGTYQRIYNILISKGNSRDEAISQLSDLTNESKEELMTILQDTSGGLV